MASMEQDDLSPDERRLFSRIAFNGQVTIIGEGSRWSSKLLDISLKGVLVGQPDHWAGQLGQHFQLELLLSDGNIVIVMDVVTAHLRDERIGFCCTHIDLDSITHLRRLLELNIADEEQLNRELSALIFNMCTSRPKS